MDSNWLEVCGNRVPLEEEANALQEAIEKDRSIAEYLKCKYEQQTSAREANQRIASAFGDSTKGIISLQQATKQLLQSIEHVQATFVSILPSQQHEEVASRIPALDQFVADWRVTLDCLSSASNILEQRLSATTERVYANQMELSGHDSLRAYATQAVDRMDTIIHELNQSIKDKRLGALHPIRRVPREILQEIFEYAVEEDHAEMRDNVDRKTSSLDRVPPIAFRISGTCRHWREIAARAPKLWRYICAPFHDSFYERRKLVGRTRFLRCLELAGERGLELTLRDETLESWEPILMEECTKQWSRITIVLTQGIPSRIPTTSRLSIYSIDYHLPETIELPDHLLSSLVVLFCSGIIPQFTSPATKLTTLHIYISDYLNGHDLGVILSHLPSLSQLTLDCFRYSSPEFTGGRIVRVHDTLKSLSITPQVLSYLASELHFISTPSLSVMKILELNDEFTERTVSRLFRVAGSIKDTVTDLYIYSSEAVSKEQEISTLIRSFSRLKRLELHGFAVTPGLGALLGTSMGPSHLQIVIKDYPEGNEKLKEIIEAAGPRASSWTISY